MINKIYVNKKTNSENMTNIFIVQKNVYKLQANANKSTSELIFILIFNRQACFLLDLLKLVRNNLYQARH